VQDVHKKECRVGFVKVALDDPLDGLTTAGRIRRNVPSFWYVMISPSGKYSITCNNHITNKIALAHGGMNGTVQLEPSVQMNCHVPYRACLIPENLGPR
jgi:hypothetical protein